MNYQTILKEIALINEAIEETTRQMSWQQAWGWCLEDEYNQHPSEAIIAKWEALRADYEANERHLNWLFGELESREVFIAVMMIENLEYASMVL